MTTCWAVSVCAVSLGFTNLLMFYLFFTLHPVTTPLRVTSFRQLLLFLETACKQDIHSFRMQSNYCFANTHNRLIGLMRSHAKHRYAYQPPEDTCWVFDWQANMSWARKPSASIAHWNRLIFGTDELLFSSSLFFIGFGFSLKVFYIFLCHTFLSEILKFLNITVAAIVPLHFCFSLLACF